MATRRRFNVVDQDDAMQDIVSSYTTNSTYGYFQVCKLFSELDTEYKKRIARRNLGLEDNSGSSKIYWEEILGNPKNSVGLENRLAELFNAIKQWVLDQNYGHGEGSGEELQLGEQYEFLYTDLDPENHKIYKWAKLLEMLAKDAESQQANEGSVLMVKPNTSGTGFIASWETIKQGVDPGNEGEVLITRRKSGELTPSWEIGSTGEVLIANEDSHGVNSSEWRKLTLSDIILGENMEVKGWATNHEVGSGNIKNGDTLAAGTTLQDVLSRFFANIKYPAIGTRPTITLTVPSTIVTFVGKNFTIGAATAKINVGTYTYSGYTSTVKPQLTVVPIDNTAPSQLIVQISPSDSSDFTCDLARDANYNASLTATIAAKNTNKIDSGMNASVTYTTLKTNVQYTNTPPASDGSTTYDVFNGNRFYQIASVSKSTEIHAIYHIYTNDNSVIDQRNDTSDDEFATLASGFAGFASNSAAALDGAYDYYSPNTYVFIRTGTCQADNTCFIDIPSLIAADPQWAPEIRKANPLDKGFTVEVTPVRETANTITHEEVTGKPAVSYTRFKFGNKGENGTYRIKLS